MSLKTRQNPQTGLLEVLINNDWIRFEEYRDRQIEDAYRKSIKFLRERLEEDPDNETEEQSEKIDSMR